MEQTYFIEKNKSHDPDGMEFFLQRAGANQISASAHIHDAVELLYIREGSYTAFMNGVQYSLNPGDLILFCANTIHHVVTGSCASNSYYVIKMRPTVLLHLNDTRQGAGYVLRFTLNRPGQSCVWTRTQLEQDTKILSILDGLINEWDERTLGFRIAMKLKIVELLLWIMRTDAIRQREPEDSEVAALIYRAMAYVQSNFASDINEESLATELGMSYSHFSRSFHKVTGIRFRQYLNSVRIDRAEQMLMTTGHSVTQIASLCGYNHVSYFISVYRRLKGKTPHQTNRKSGV